MVDQSGLNALDRALRLAEAAAAAVAGFMMLAAMVLTSADALMRYGLNRPLNFNYFLTESYLMVGIVCMPMAWAFRTGGYIRISFLLHMLPARLGLVLLRVGLLASVAYIADLAWLAGMEWFRLFRTGEVEMGVIDWPWSWSWIWIPIGLGLLVLRLLLLAFGPAAVLTIIHDAEEDGV